MTTIRFLRRDIRLGIIRRAYMYIIAVIFSFVMVQQCSSSFESLKSINYVWSDGTVMDYLIFSFKGMNYYRFDPKESFQLPLLWFIFQIGVSYFVAYYPEKDYRENGVNVIVAGKSRTCWWLSKMIWCFLSVLIYYVISIFFCIVFALMKGAELSIDISYDYLQAYFGYNMTYISPQDLILIAVIVPSAVTVGICFMQLLLSFVISPVISFAVTCMMYILSAFYTTWMLPGNFTMWLRSSYYCEDGINPLSGLIIASFSVIIVLCSSILLKRR